VVVNAGSIESRTIANHYVALRDIPGTNVVWLDEVPGSPSIDIRLFRERIWNPILTYLQAHGLEDQIDVIAYSAGFPYAVDFGADLKGHDVPKTMRNLIGRVASLTGLTFFARHVQTGSIGYLGRNQYARRDVTARTKAPRPLSGREEVQLMRARKLVQRKQFDEALILLSSLAAAYPWSPRIWYELAVSQAALERDSEALRSLGRAVDAGWPYSLMARSERRFNRLRDAPQFQELIERMQQKPTLFQPAHGFRGRYVWHGAFRPEQNGPRDSLDRYFLSVMLGYTGAQGNTTEEVVRYLERATASDDSHPNGTVYLMENGNIRAQTRERYFFATAKALAKRGRRVEIVGPGKGQDGIVPRNKTDVIGAVVGAADFHWLRSGSRFLPGAIAESLTSYGGDFKRRKQTKLSEFLRHGAAGSSGAVAEPYSIQAKFPVSYMHVHYADGSSLAEAFYQSIEAPYQLIVVGDPLARPFANFAHVSLASPDIDGAWKGTVELKPRVVPPEGHESQHLELWVDGKVVDAIAPWDTFRWDTRTVDDGYHDLRIIAVDADRIETRSYAKLGIQVVNTAHWVTAGVQRKNVPFEDDIVFEGAAPNPSEVLVFHGGRQLASAQVDGTWWKATLPASAVGPGPVQLFARARFPDDHGTRSAPISVDIASPKALEAPQTKETRPQ